jgi:hypothetical protein
MLDRRASFSLRDQGPLKRLRLALCLAMFLVGIGPAHAATVAILWPPTPSADVTQALTLLRGELLSLGLEVTMSERAGARSVGETDSVAWLEAFAARGTSAVIDAVGDDVLEAVDVWVLKTQPQRFEVTRVAVENNAPRQPEMVALRAVEALRAGLLQIDWAARKRRDEPIAKPPAAVVRADQTSVPTGRGERVGVDLGAAAVMGLDGLGLAVLPTLSLGWAAGPSLVLQATGAGLGSKSTVSTTTGSARVAQQYALVGARYRFHSARRLWPFLGIGAGLLRTRVEGQSGWGTGGQTLAQWSGLLDMSLGAGLRLHGRSYLTLAVHAQLADPYVAVHIVDRVGATSGRPNLLFTLTVGAWL